MLMSIVGEFDKNLKNLSKMTSTDIFLEEIQLLVKDQRKILIYFVML